MAAPLLLYAFLVSCGSKPTAYCYFITITRWKCSQLIIQSEHPQWNDIAVGILYVIFDNESVCQPIYMTFAFALSTHLKSEITILPPYFLIVSRCKYTQNPSKRDEKYIFGHFLRDFERPYNNSNGAAEWPPRSFFMPSL